MRAWPDACLQRVVILTSSCFRIQASQARTDAGKFFTRKDKEKMKYAGLLVMPAGFFLAIAALVLFPAGRPGARLAFVLCGLAVEALGLAVAVRGHRSEEGKHRS